MAIVLQNVISSPRSRSTLKQPPSSYLQPFYDNSRAMPGPRNAKKQKKLQAKKEKKKVSPKSPSNPSQPPVPPPPGLTPPPLIPELHDLTRESEETIVTKLYNSDSIPILPYPALSHPSTPKYLDGSDDSHDYNDTSELQASILSSQTLPKEPYIHDPGNGPRVKDMDAFLASPFAARPSLDDPLCAEFAQEDLIDMLCQVLPEETALVSSLVRFPGLCSMHL